MTGQYTLIVGAAPAPMEGSAYRRIIRAAPRLIAADGGLMLCIEAGRMPEVVVGDMDSVDGDVLIGAERAGVQIERHPVAKDQSDLDLALRRARESGPEDVRFTAAFSGRLDHTLAALGTLLRSADRGGRAEEPSFHGYALDSRFRASLTSATRGGQRLSMFALDPGTIVSVSGVRYPLSEEPLPVLSSRGLSNVALGDAVTVTVHSGSVVVLVES